MARLKTLRPRIEVQAGRMTIAPLAESWRNGETSSTKRGYGYKWQQARAGFLAKHPLCVFCLQRDLVVAASVVDHRTPHRGDMDLFWDSTNWQPLCKPCHDGAKQRMETRGG